jgi:hypothetical protein
MGLEPDNTTDNTDHTLFEPRFFRGYFTDAMVEAISTQLYLRHGLSTEDYICEATVH